MHSQAPAKRPDLRTLALVLLVTSACGARVSDAPVGEARGATPQPEVIFQEDITLGVGSFMLEDPRLGLSDLPSYTATLTLSFDGTKDGDAYQWSKTYVMDASREPQARKLSVQRTGDLANLVTDYMAERDGAAYTWQGESTCTAGPIREGEALGDLLEPAGLLSWIVGAEEAGSETANGVPSNHYTFDERALAQEGLTDSTGDLWVAAEGGYVVRYLVTAEAQADYFGDGIEGTLTQDYQLTGIGEPVEIQLPEDCPAGMVDAPLLPDAENVTSYPGLLSYQSATGLQDAAAFYQKELPSLGWAEQEDSSISEEAASLHFVQGGQDITLVLAPEGDTTTITISLARIQT